MEEHEEIVIEEEDSDNIEDNERVGNAIRIKIREDMEETPPNLSLAEMEMARKNGTRQAGMDAIYRHRFHADGAKYGEKKNHADDWDIARSKKAGKNVKAGVTDHTGVVKSRTAHKLGSKEKASTSNRDRMLVEDVAARMGLMVDDAGGKPAEVCKKDGASTQKLTGNCKEAGGSKAKTGGTFIDVNGRRKDISEEESARYRDVANNNELFDRKFCESYEHLLASVTCTMAKCMETGCVLRVFTKGHAFKDTTTVKARGSVKGTKCGKSVTFGTCLQQWFGLGILDDISRQAKARETPSAPPMPVQAEEERMKAEQRGRNERAIALIAENVTNTLNQVDTLAQQIEAPRENARRMQASLEDAVRRRDAGEDFDTTNVAPPMRYKLTHPTR